MTVWAVHPVSDDLSAAEGFGELRYINANYIYPDELVQLQEDYHESIPQPVLVKMVEAADQFAPTTDYLLIVGDHLQLIQFASMLREKYFSFSVLRYDREAKGYIPVEIMPMEAAVWQV